MSCHHHHDTHTLPSLWSLLNLAYQGLSFPRFLSQAIERVLAQLDFEAYEVWLLEGAHLRRWRGEPDKEPARRPRLLALGLEANCSPNALLDSLFEASPCEVLWHSQDKACAALAIGMDPNHPQQQSLLLPFECGRGACGLLIAHGQLSADRTFQDRCLWSERSRALGVSIATHRSQAALTERVKELSCMYGIAQLAASPNRPLDTLIADIVELLPPAWQYPELTSAKVTLDDESYTSRGFQEGAHSLQAPIVCSGVRPRQSRNPLRR